MDENQIPNPYTTAQQYPNEAPQKKKGFAIAAMVLGIVSICLFCCCVNVVTAPLAIIFAIIALAKHQGGKGMSITGIILATISLLLSAVILLAFKDFIPYAQNISNDYVYIYEHQDEVMAAYEKDQTLPECLEKYKEPPYSSLLSKYEITIYDVMDVLLETYDEAGSLPAMQNMTSTDYTVKTSE